MMSFAADPSPAGRRSHQHCERQGGHSDGEAPGTGHGVCSRREPHSLCVTALAARYSHRAVPWGRRSQILLQGRCHTVHIVGLPRRLLKMDVLMVLSTSLCTFSCNNIDKEQAGVKQQPHMEALGKVCLTLLRIVHPSLASPASLLYRACLETFC